MLFKPELAEKVMDGAKTQTRRVRFPHILAVKLHKLDSYLPATGAEWMKWAEMSTMSVRNAIHRANRVLQFNVVELPIQPGRGKSMLGRRQVESLGYHRLQVIKDVEIVKEGVEGDSEFDRRQAFIELWDTVNPKKANRWAQDPFVFTIEFSRRDNKKPLLEGRQPNSGVYFHITERDEF